jgi:deoxyadenosine/deoxycytidine kinase
MRRMRADVPFIAVAGNIAAGKTGLVSRLAEDLGAQALTEDVAANPYFDRYYREPERWAFHSQVAFVADSLRRHVVALRGGAAVQDRTIYETIDVFSRLLWQEGHLSDDQMETLTTFRECAQGLPRQPTLLIHLHAPVPELLRRIALRSRESEQAIDTTYLTRLADLYDEFVEGWDICPIVRVNTEAHDLREPGEVERLLADVVGTR